MAAGAALVEMTELGMADSLVVAAEGLLPSGRGAGLTAPEQVPYAIAAGRPSRRQRHGDA